MAGPLEGVKVIDVSQVVLGPLATQIMGDMGAEVIKVEPLQGDITRSIGPRRSQGMASMFLGCNRNKRSLCLDLKREEGRRVLLRLVESSDVFLHSMRPQAIQRLGLTYPELSRVNPKLLYVGCSGYRRDGPYGARPAYDDIIQALSGLTSLQQHLFGEHLYIPSIICDKTTALSAVANVSMALFHRERSGVGQELEITMFETMAAFNLVEHLYGAVFVPTVDQLGYARVLSSERRPYETLDGHIALLPYNDRQWRQMFGIMGREDLARDPRFETVDGRNANIHELYREWRMTMRTKTTAEGLEILADTDLPHARVATLDDLLSDSHLEAIEFWHTVEHPSEGTLRMPGVPAKLSRTPGTVSRPPPRLGEHSVAVLEAAQFEPFEIESLLRSGVTRQYEDLPDREEIP